VFFGLAWWHWDIYLHFVCPAALGFLVNVVGPVSISSVCLSGMHINIHFVKFFSYVCSHLLNHVVLCCSCLLAVWYLLFYQLFVVGFDSFLVLAYLPAVIVNNVVSNCVVFWLQCEFVVRLWLCLGGRTHRGLYFLSFVVLFSILYKHFPRCGRVGCNPPFNAVTLVSIGRPYSFISVRTEGPSRHWQIIYYFVCAVWATHCLIIYLLLCRCRADAGILFIISCVPCGPHIWFIYLIY
jgi:hypothetical protein